MKIINVGLSGFPEGNAAIKKQELISRALQEGGNEVTVLSRFGVSGKKQYPRKGIFRQIHYVFCSPLSYRHKNPIFNLINKRIGVFNEYFWLLFNDYDLILSNSRSFYKTFFYTSISKIRKKKIVLTLVEDNESVPKSNNAFGKLDNKLFSKYTWKIVDGCFPISNYLSDKVKKKNPLLPLYKLPVFVDLESFNIPIKETTEEAFLFCGSLAYWEVIKFIIDAFLLNQLKSNLILIVSGEIKRFEILREYLKNTDTNNKVIVKTQLSEEELIQNYLSAKALLIPLRNTIQDIARFPHKIGEYCASKKPIISSDVGEISYYFKHKENALLMNSYDVNECAELMKLLDDNEKICKLLGENCYQVAQNNFDYKSHTNPLNKFLKEL